MAANLDHPAVRMCQPDNSSMKIWRYMDLPKLVDFLQTRTLHFARADTLDDRFEGTWTLRNEEAREHQIQEILKESEKIPNRKKAYSTAELRRMFQDSTHRDRQCVYVNCWHGGETENAAMWKLYGSTTGSVAIQSTYKKLASALPEQIYMDDVPAGEVYLGAVQYKDYDNRTDWILGGNVMYPFMHKRKEFQHEVEVRALTWTMEGMSKARREGGNYMPLGIRAAVDIGSIVDTIRVQPATPPWVTRAIEALIEKYGWGLKVTRSVIDVEPRY